jgi:hypothetical protein
MLFNRLDRVGVDGSGHVLSFTRSFLPSALWCVTVRMER